MALFSSSYSADLFIPFLENFLTDFSNPWHSYFLMGHDNGAFPYPPLMLYILSVFYAPFYFFGLESTLLQNFFFKLPTLLADLTIIYILLRMFPKKTNAITLFYVYSPIVFYASYIHSQLDLIPSAFLLASVYLLIREKPYFSAILLGLTFSVKFHTVAALPILMIYVYRNFGLKAAIEYVLLPLAIFLFFVLPYMSVPGFYDMVLNNPKQALLFGTIYHVGHLEIYVPILAILILYARFGYYMRVNKDLLIAYLGLTFAVFVLLVSPAPGWYLWLFPFLSIFYIKMFQKKYPIIWMNLTLSGVYLLYFIFFYQSGLSDIIFLDHTIDLKVTYNRLNHFMFTLLEALLLGNIYLLYKFGVKSNKVYHYDHAYAIGIGGDSGVGKSTLLNIITDTFYHRTLEIEGDGDHKWERGNENWNTFTHLDPKANYIHRQAENIIALKSGRPAYRSDYDHATGQFTDAKKIVPKDFIVISGLHPFYLPKMRKTLDLKIYLDTDENLRRHWKIVRDTKKRGYSMEQILRQIEMRMEDAKKYIYPQKQFADLVIHYFSDDPFELGNPESNLQVKLKITLDSNIHLEHIINTLEDDGIKFFWDFSDDLKSQTITLNNETGLDKPYLSKLANENIENYDELVLDEETWREGYKGFIQLMLLIIISNDLKDKGMHSEF